MDKPAIIFTSIIGVVLIVQIVFVTLSLIGIVDWSSAVVFSPSFFTFVIGFTYLCISSAIDEERLRRASIQRQKDMLLTGEQTFMR